jgi:hypothetical protein
MPNVAKCLQWALSTHVRQHPPLIFNEGPCLALLQSDAKTSCLNSQSHPTGSENKILEFSRATRY